MKMKGALTIAAKWLNPRYDFEDVALENPDDILYQENAKDAFGAAFRQLRKFTYTFARGEANCLARGILIGGGIGGAASLVVASGLVGVSGQDFLDYAKETTAACAAIGGFIDINQYAYRFVFKRYRGDFYK